MLIKDHLHNSSFGLFMRPLAWLGDVHVVSEKGTDCTSFVRFVMETGGANLQQYLTTNMHVDKFRTAVDLVKLLKQRMTAKCYFSISNECGLYILSASDG